MSPSSARRPVDTRRAGTTIGVEVGHPAPVRLERWRVLAAGAALGLVAGCSSWPAFGDVTPPAPPSGTAAPTGSAPATAAAALAALPVKGRAPKTGYTRSQFGPAWADVDQDGCDQRNQVLARDLTAPVFRKSAHPCVVLSGTLTDAYTGVTVPFTRGPDTSGKVQIDHLVALSDAWQTGAQALDAAARARFAGDPLNLQAVEGPVNQGKGDGDAASWLPPARGYRCAYVARQVAVKAVYRLWVTSAEREAIARVLAGCPGQAVPPSPLR